FARQPLSRFDRRATSQWREPRLRADRAGPRTLSKTGLQIARSDAVEPCKLLATTTAAGHCYARPRCFVRGTALATEIAASAETASCAHHFVHGGTRIRSPRNAGIFRDSAVHRCVPAIRRNVG